ncbi:MAG: DUF58 domain-containing protein [Anaerolineae bacterium]
MKPAWLLIALSAALAIAGLAMRSTVLLLPALPLLLYLAAGLWRQPPAPQLVASRRVSPTRAYAGEPVQVTLTITNRGGPLPELQLADALPPGLTVTEGNTGLLAALSPGQSLTLAYTVTAARGLHRFGAARAVVRDPLGLFEQQAAVDAPGQFLVMPALTRLRRVAIRPPRTGIYAGMIPARQGGPGVEFFGVREYQPGDPLRWLNERAGARHQQRLFVNQFQQERVVDVGLILDARLQSDAVAGGESLFEHSVAATAALADAFLSDGNRVGLFIYGRSLDWTFPGYGKVQRERIMRTLAQAQQGDGSVFEKLEHLPTRLFPVRSQLVFVSPLLPQDAEMLIWLRARGYRLLVISPDPVTFEAATLPNTEANALALRLARLERALTLRQLRQAGARVVDWPVDRPFYQVAHAALAFAPAQPVKAVR